MTLFTGAISMPWGPARFAHTGRAIRVAAFVMQEALFLSKASPVACHSSLLAALQFGRGNKTITGMTSSEGESFAFRSTVPVEGGVECWMTAVEAEMRRTLAAIMKEGECACGGGAAGIKCLIIRL